MAHAPIFENWPVTIDPLGNFSLGPAAAQSIGLQSRDGVLMEIVILERLLRIQAGAGA